MHRAGLNRGCRRKHNLFFFTIVTTPFSYRSLCCLSRIVDGGRAAGYVWVEYTEDTERKRDG